LIIGGGENTVYYAPGAAAQGAAATHVLMHLCPRVIVPKEPVAPAFGDRP